MLRDWWSANGHRWKDRRGLAVECGIKEQSLYAYFAGRTFPSKQHCAALYKVSGLDCFGPGMVESRVLHVQLRQLRSAWCRNFLIDLHGAIKSHTDSPRTREGLRASTFPILHAAESAGFTSRNGITPLWLIGVELRIDQRRTAWAKGFVARFLQGKGLWTEEQLNAFNDGSRNAAATNRRLAALSVDYDKRPAKLLKANKEPNPAQQLCDLAWALIYQCGVSVAEMRTIRISHVSDLGLLVPSPSTPRIRQRKGRVIPHPHRHPSRVIPFGEGWDQLPRAVLDAYLQMAEPTDFLFYSLHPRDKGRRVSRQTLAAAVHAREPREDNARSLRESHFRQDFLRARDLSELRFHLRNVHGLHNAYAHELVKRLAVTFRFFPMPVPYLLAALCASRLLPGIPVANEGGKRVVFMWENLFGYDVGVDWPANFAQALVKHPKVAQSVFRGLLRAAHDLRGRQLQLRPHTVKRSTRRQGGTNRQKGFSSNIENWLALTRLTITNRTNGVAWAGTLFESRNRRRWSTVPLVENMEAGQWRPRCQVCGHASRKEIEHRAASLLAAATRIKGLRSLAEAYGVSYFSLLRHIRRIGARAHSAPANPAAMIQCPRDLVDRVSRLSGTALCLSVFALLQRRCIDSSDVTISAREVEDRMGIRLADNDLLGSLGDLKQSGLIQKFRECAASEFSVDLFSLTQI